MNAVIRLALPVLLAASTVTARADTLYGSQVTFTGDYPVLGTPFTKSVTATVGPGIEFPSGSVPILSSSEPLIGVNIDVGVNNIALNYTEVNTSARAAFNGYVFDFSHLSSPILGAFLDPSSSYSASQVVVGLSGDEVTVNVGSGIPTGPGDTILVDLSLPITPPTPVSTPEPSTIVLFGTGLLGAVGAVRRRFAS